MKNVVFIALTMSLFFIHQTESLRAEVKPQEVVTIVQDAVDYIGKTGESGIRNLSYDKRWDQGELYIFAYDCKKQIIIAHPKVRKLIGKSLGLFKDRKGNFFALQACNSLENSEKTWIDYWWLHPLLKKSTRKISLYQKVPGTDFTIGSGIYNEVTSTEMLNRSFR